MHSTGSTEGVAFLAVAIMETKGLENRDTLTKFDMLYSLVTTTIYQGYENGWSIMLRVKYVILLEYLIWKKICYYCLL